MLCPLLAAPSYAAGDNAVQMVQALGILDGTNLTGAVSRAEFANMLVAASSYKDSISGEGSGYSLFKDVKSGHWASEYIRCAVSEGWMTGYTDGTFRPDQTVKLEEACSAVLKLLGYDSGISGWLLPQRPAEQSGGAGPAGRDQPEAGGSHDRSELRLSLFQPDDRQDQRGTGLC